MDLLFTFDIILTYVLIRGNRKGPGKGWENVVIPSILSGKANSWGRKRKSPVLIPAGFAGGVSAGLLIGLLAALCLTFVRKQLSHRSLIFVQKPDFRAQKAAFLFLFPFFVILKKERQFSLSLAQGLFQTCCRPGGNLRYRNTLYFAERRQKE